MVKKTTGLIIILLCFSLMAAGCASMASPAPESTPGEPPDSQEPVASDGEPADGNSPDTPVWSPAEGKLVTFTIWGVTPDLMYLVPLTVEADHPEDRPYQAIEALKMCIRDRDDDVDKILGLELGADDYLTKPFNPRELVARIKAILRRMDRINRLDTEVITRGRIQLDLDRHQVTAGGQAVDLTPKEFELLELLIKNPGRVFSREILLERLWGYDFFGDSKTIDVHIRRLREKVEEDPSSPTHILTVWGVGYKFREF